LGHTGGEGDVALATVTAEGADALADGGRFEVVGHGGKIGLEKIRVNALAFLLAFAYIKGCDQGGDDDDRVSE
jgi:hypothetical protein